MHPVPLLVALALFAPSLLEAPASAPLAVSGVQEDEGEEAWNFIAGLARRELHDQVVREATRFLRDHDRHDRVDDVRYRLGDALFELGRAADARPHFAELARREGFALRGEAGYRLGQCALEGGDLRAAAQALSEVAEGGPEYLQDPATFLCGEALFQDGQFLAARQRFAAVDPEGERAADAQHAEAWCAFRLEDMDGVVELCQRFEGRFGSDPRVGELAYLMGEAHLAAGRAVEARKAFARVPEGSHRVPALRGAAFAAADAGDRRGAAAAFKALLDLDPRGPHAREAALHRGVHLFELDGPAAALEAWSEHSPGASAEALSWVARAQVGVGQAEVALRTLERALAQAGLIDELKARLQTTRGDALAALGQLEAAAEAWHAADTDWGLQAAAATRLQLGRYEAAIATADELLAREPGEFHDEVRLVRAEAQFALEDWATAETSFAAVAESDPDPADRARAVLRRGWCWWLMGDAAAARPHFEAAAHEHGQHEGRLEAVFLAGRCAEALGDAAAARAGLLDYLQVAPDGPHAAEAGLRLGRLTEGPDGEVYLARVADELSGSPFAPRALFELAERLAVREDGPAAIQRYRQLIETYPDDALVDHARYGLGWTLWAAGDAPGAAAPLWAAASGEVDSIVTASLELLVWVERKSGRAARARRACLAFAARVTDPDRRVGAAREASFALVEAGEPGQALSLWGELRSNAPAPAEAARIDIERAHLLLAGGRADDAQALLDGVHPDARAVEGLGEAYLFLGEARFDAGELEAALLAYDRAVALGGPFEVVPRALYKGGFARLRLERLDEAAQAFDALVTRYPDCSLVGESLFLLGEAYYRAGSFAQAEQALARVVEQHPRHEVRPKALFRLGLARGELARWAAAVGVLTELLREHPDFEAALEADLWRGRALLHTDRPRAARAAFERVAAADTGVLSARARLGLGRLAEAEDDAESALSEYLKVAVLYAHAEEVAEALYRAGEILQAQGKDENARARFEEAARDHPDTTFGRRAKERIDQDQASHGDRPR